MKHTNRKRWIETAGICLLFAVLFTVCDQTTQQAKLRQEAGRRAQAGCSWKQAQTTPFGKYPELVTYTLGKVTAEDNANMPEGDTYEDNNYTRYLRELLNVQNKDVLEGMNNQQYEQMEKMSILEDSMPDIMVVTSQKILDTLVQQDLIEDLTDTYETCASFRMKEMYASYGRDQLDSVTYDGKLMAYPETEVYTGPALLWLRKDWMDKLGLQEPKTMEEAMQIIRKFVKENPGENRNENVGLVFDPELVGKTDQCFSLDPLFESYGAYPQKWIPQEDGTMVYGSVAPQMRTALKAIADDYQEGVLDPSFMLSNAKNLSEFLQNGQCGAFFGWWWAPNSPLASIYDENADWQPYLFENAKGVVKTTIPYGRHYCVVAKKGFAHPEIIPKILSAVYDYARYDGREEAKEVGEYLGMNVNQSATPFVINIDYSDAIFRTSSNMDMVRRGQRSFDSLNVLERGYYRSCEQYLKSEKPQAFEWAAYMSRITAIDVLKNKKIIYVNKGYTQEYDRLQSEKLTDLEQKTFLKIITGEEPITYFDWFVKEWYKNGGTELTEMANNME